MGYDELPYDHLDHRGSAQIHGGYLMSQTNHPADQGRTMTREADLRATRTSNPPSSPPVPLVPRKQGAWGLWWLCIVTFSIYYFIWYDRINGELSTILGQPRRANSRWWNQIVPFWGIVGLAATAKRLNAAHASVGSPTRVGIFTTWFWAPGWFGSQTRYLQRRINILHDVLTSRTAHQGY